MMIEKSKIFKDHIKVIYTENEYIELIQKMSIFQGFDYYINKMNKYLSDR